MKYCPWKDYPRYSGACNRIESKRPKATHPGDPDPNCGAPNRRTINLAPAGHGQHGLILIEVLIAGLILVLGIGSLAAAQQSTLKTITAAEVSSLLVDLHGSLVDRLKLNPDAVRNGEFDIHWVHGVSNDSPTDSATSEFPLLSDILITLRNTGAQGYVQIQCDQPGSSHCDICIGIYQLTIGKEEIDLDLPPPNKLCSRQRIL